MCICVKPNSTCAEVWVDELYEMTAVDVKGRDPKTPWEIVGIYRAPNENTRVLEKLTDRTGHSVRTTYRCFIGGVLNLRYADWNGHAEKPRGTQVYLNRLV
jgi:hypothetical protein